MGGSGERFSGIEGTAKQRGKGMSELRERIGRLGHAADERSEENA
jgi:hypothetical protein